ncbi:MAG TPA: TonB family protein [Bryobacteraceae bacterium]|nr:TonB family protein [Bryobacteraceae bacterium]
METISRYLLTYFINALWQIAIIAAVAALACRLLRHAPAAYRHAVWVVALAAAVLAPLASEQRSLASELAFAGTSSAIDSPALDANLPTTVWRGPARVIVHAQSAKAESDSRAADRSSRIISFATATTLVLAGLYLCLILFTFARFLAASIRTIAIRRSARPLELPEPLSAVWNRCLESFDQRGAQLLFSSRISGPLTVAGAVILPDSMRAETSEEVLTTALGHELAHIARRDFACNLLFELLCLPVGFHPAIRLIRRGVERAREMACDDLVTRKLIAPAAYARSIVLIAEAMLAPARPAHALGVLDGENLEERIRRLVQPAPQNHRRARLLLVSSLAALVFCALAASNLALTARAQSGVTDLLKAGVDAYRQGNYPAAASSFQSAVQLEPSNIKAKLDFARALTAQYIPGSDPSNPVVALAKQQYQDALAIDPQNADAINSMIDLLLRAKQWGEAHDWALKDIQANLKSTVGYYTAGFIDWSITYPDFAAAHRAAGMTMQEQGQITDAALRQAFKTKHSADIEEGFRMLQVALQIDPNYSDAMAYLNLLYRLQAGMADTPAQADQALATANDWVSKALAAKREVALNPPPPPDSDALELPKVQAPPPPPPPPPPPGQNSQLAQGQPHATLDEPSVITVGGRVQAAKLFSSVPPIYPPAARAAGVSGQVLLNVIIDKTGSVDSVTPISGDPTLVPAAVDAVRLWKYQPTYLNSKQIAVSTQITINFTLGQ